MRTFAKCLVGSVIALLSVTVVAAWYQSPKKQGSDKPSRSETNPKWIWLGKPAVPGQTLYFRKTIPGRLAIISARIYGTCDDVMTVFINGKEVIRSDRWQTPASKDVTDLMRVRGQPRPKRHVIAVKAVNRHGPVAGLLIRLDLESPRGELPSVVSDASWRVTDQEVPGWNQIDFDDRSWKRAIVVGTIGDGPWRSITPRSLLAAAKLREPTATPPERLTVRDGFRVELLYSVPKEKQGSWVNLCVAPGGQLIASDQYGALYRVTPPPVGGRAEDTRVERIPVEIGEAQGLLWAFDSLYVVVNRGQKYASGLYRVQDTDGDGELDTVRLLRRLDGGGEHGPHAVLLAPDGKSLFVLCGNHTNLTRIDASRVPRVWQEDQLLPRMWDARGHARGRLAPGGWIARVDPEGKHWELFSIGYRNQYDATFNRDGELFTYDADMEWDMNTPWYRPTRVCHAVSGSEFGWRSGTGKWPPYYPDSLPPAVEIGPGSPTGITFGYGARFPAKYQEALFLCDWSYGKLYAVHLKPKGASYGGEFEEFLSGAPLPLTDIVVHPGDGAMYFTIGGRRTKSGLYRIVYVGNEPTTPVRRDANGSKLRALRHRLERFHGQKDPRAVEEAWPFLGHPDRFIRFAARTAIEHQPVSTWQQRALAERHPQAALTALLALTRVGPKEARSQVLDALARIDWGQLTYWQKLAMLRVYALAFIRLGPPTEQERNAVIQRFDAVYPSNGRELNSELCRVLVYLQAPSAAEKTMTLLRQAPTQEEQMDYVLCLRNLTAGWTLELRREYFRWFLKAANYKGGASFSGFVRNIKAEAVSHLSEEEKAELHDILTAKPTRQTPITQPQRPFVKKWTVAELAPIVENGLKGRDYDRGRAMFAAATCFACHRFANEGGAIGPDLTGVAGRFSPRDLLESIIEPNKVISDQYAAVILELNDGRLITGRIVNLNGDNLSVNTNMLDPDALVNVDRRQIESMRPSPVSMMPAGLLDTLHKDEILDLMAYLLSRGDRNHAMFKK